MSVAFRRKAPFLQAVANFSTSSAAARNVSPTKGASASSSSNPATAAAATAAGSSPSSSSASTLISHLQPSTLPLFTSPTYHKKSLYEHLSSLPNNGIGTRVRQVKWSAKGIDQPFNVPFKGPVVIPQERKEENHLCYWEITRARIKISNGENNRKPHGKAWGRLTWRGVPVTPEGKEERIRGGLRYSWDKAL